MRGVVELAPLVKTLDLASEAEARRANYDKGWEDVFVARYRAAMEGRS